MRLELRSENQTELIVDDDLFGHLKFQYFNSESIKKIGSKAFRKSAQSMLTFRCLDCNLVNEPPNYYLWSAFSQIKDVLEVDLGSHR